MRRGFLSFCGRTPVASAKRKAQNTAANFKALGQRGHHATLSACAALRAEQSFRSKCAHRKVWFSVAGIKLFGCSVTLPLSDFFNVPTAPQRLRCAALRLYEQTFHVPYRRFAVLGHISRFYQLFGKNISLLRGRYARILLALIRAKISRP